MSVATYCHVQDESTTNSSAMQYHPWKAERATRRTFSIHSSSLITMLSCVWTAVHLNTPQQGKWEA